MIDADSTVDFSSFPHYAAMPDLGLLMGAMFDKAFRKFSEAFEQRAGEIYR